MCADKNAGRGNLAKHRIQNGPITFTLDGIYPHQYTIDLDELLTNFLTTIVVIDGGFRLRSQRGQCVEYL